MASRKRLEIADLYPDAKARLAADDAVDALSLELPMTEYIKAWELAYQNAGGKVRLPRKKI